MKFYQGDYSDLIEFSAAVVENPFGSVLLELAENNYEDVDTAVIDIAETLTELGYDASEDAVLGLMTGEIVPDEDVVEILAELAVVEDDETLTEKNVSKLYQGAISAYEIAEALLEAEAEVDESEEDEEYPVTSTVEVSDYETYDTNEEEYYADEEEEDSVVVELDDETEATFSRYFDEVDQLRTRQVVTDELSSLREYANELLSERCLTPHAYNLLFSKSAKDDFINFSQATEKAGLAPEDYLMCMNFALNMFEEMGPIAGSKVNFSSVVNQNISDGPINFSTNKSQITDEAREMLNLMRGDRDQD